MYWQSTKNRIIRTDSPAWGCPPIWNYSNTSHTSIARIGRFI